MNPKPDHKSGGEKGRELPVEVINQFLQTQHQQALNEAEELKLKQKQLEYNAKYAEVALKLQAEHLKNKPAEARKTFKMFGWFGIAAILIFIGFIGFCLYLGREEFVLKFLQFALYPALTGAGYWAGIKKRDSSNGKSKDMEDETGAEVL